MKSTSICIVGFLFCLSLLSGTANATSIDVTFSTAASFNDDATFSLNADSGTLSPDTVLHFQGGTFSVTLPDPTLSVDQIFGTMWVTKTKEGSVGFTDEIPFALQITQTFPDNNSGPIELTATFTGKVKGSDSIILDFSTPASGVIDSSDANITYSILPASLTMTFPNTGKVKNIKGQLSDPTPAAVPEPTTLVLLGTGILGIGLAAYRRKRN